MSDYEERDMSGTLWKNDKGDNDKRPDMRGTVTIAGKQWELAAWTKQGRKGKFLSLSVQEPREREAKPDDAPPSDDAEGSMPF